MEVDSARSGPSIGEGVPRLVRRFLTFQHCFWRGANRRGTASQRQRVVVGRALTLSHLSVAPTTAPGLSQEPKSQSQSRWRRSVVS